MIFGVGTDIIETERVKNQLEQVPGLREKVFTPAEIEYCESKKRKEQNYAARFAAKEAFFKALGTGWRDGLAYIEVEMINLESGKPEIKLYGKSKDTADKAGIKNIFVSVSHIKEMANAVVILEI